MKLWKKILLGIIWAIIALVVALCVWQCSNITAVWKAMNSSSEEIAREMDVAKKELEDELIKDYPIIVSDFTAEEEKKIIKGEITYEEAVSSMNEKYENKKETIGTNSENKNADNSAAAERLIGDKVVELYSIKAYYLGQLGQIEASVKRDYAKLPKEKRNLVGKKSLVDKYMGTALGLLGKCDDAVAGVLSELETGLKNLNADTAIVNKIKQAYEKEKELKKAYYISLLEE